MCWKKLSGYRINTTRSDSIIQNLFRFQIAFSESNFKDDWFSKGINTTFPLTRYLLYSLIPLLYCLNSAERIFAPLYQEGRREKALRCPGNPIKVGCQLLPSHRGKDEAAQWMCPSPFLFLLKHTYHNYDFTRALSTKNNHSRWCHGHHDSTLQT
jgi:hypothetical protein